MRSHRLLTLTVACSLLLTLLAGSDVAHAATITVDSTGDDNPADADDGDCTLREAIDAANSNAAEDNCPAGSGATTDLIVVPAGTYVRTVTGSDENAGETGDLDILESVTIQGAGPKTTTVDANSIDRVFHIATSSLTVEFSGLTIRGGGPGPEGGGIFNEASELTVRNSFFTDNEGAWGGAMANDGPGTLTITDTLIAGNRAPGDVGGGIDFDSDLIGTLTNVTVTGNTATEGGGIWVCDSSMTLNNVTVAGNSATSSGEGGGLHNNCGGDLIVRNSIVAGNTNTEGTAGANCAGSITSQGYTLLGHAEGCTFTSATGDKVGTVGAPIDPKLGPLADNGGPTMTHALLPGSPAIDAGNPATPGTGAASCAGTDQRGATRPEGAACEMGAFEVPAGTCQGLPATQTASEGADVLEGTSGIDVFAGLGGDDIIEGLGGADRICGGGGNDRLKGGGGKDRLIGEAGKDRLNGGGGKDRLVGGPGRDACVGGGGSDKGSSCKSRKGIP